MKSFKIRSGGKILDYRQGEKLNLNEIKSFFQSSYDVKKIWNGNRHVLGILAKNGLTYFLKLSTSEGISIVTENEYKWNNYFNTNFPKNFPYRVPKNYDSGLFKNKYFYLITDYLEGALLCKIDAALPDSNGLIKYMPSIIEYSHLIKQLPVVNFTNFKIERNFKKRFVGKVNNWFIDIPENVRKRHNLRVLLELVETGTPELLSKPRHGDFTPWHIIKLSNSRLGLIDGEHAQVDSVEGYDICYFIQRVFAVLKNPGVAQRIYLQLLKKGYIKNKLKTVLSARAIGGFLDESLKKKPDYGFAVKFKDWVIGC